MGLMQVCGDPLSGHIQAAHLTQVYDNFQLWRLLHFSEEGEGAGDADSKGFLGCPPSRISRMVALQFTHFLGAYVGNRKLQMCRPTLF